MAMQQLVRRGESNIILSEVWNTDDDTNQCSYTELPEASMQMAVQQLAWRGKPKAILHEVWNTVAAYEHVSVNLNACQ